MSAILRSIALSALLLAGFIPSFAQQRNPLKWDSVAQFHRIPDSLKDEPAVVILEEKQTQMQHTSEGFELYYTVHLIVRINDEKGAESFNTFNVPVAPAAKLGSIRARTIFPDNRRPIVVGRDKVKKLKNEAGYYEYLLALEGVEPGVEIELIYTQINGGTAASTEVFQMGVPVMEARFRLIAPDNMIYDLKGFNGFPKPKDSLMGDQRLYRATSYNLPAADEEPVSYLRPYLQRVDYKLSYVTRAGSDTMRRMSWKEMAQQLSARYGHFSRRERDAAVTILERQGIHRSDPDSVKIRQIESYLKKQVALSAEVSDEPEPSFSAMIQNRAAGEKGLVHLFAACLNAAGVSYETGMADSRSDFRIDDSLEIWSHADVYLFYFPALGSYLSPLDEDLRFPFVSPEQCGARGIFTKNGVGTETEVRADIRTITCPPLSASGMDIRSEVSFEKDLLPVVRSTQSFQGYAAQPFLGDMEALDHAKQQELVLALGDLSDKPEDLREFSFANTGYGNFASGKALEISSVTQAPALLEKAGPQYLFKAGALIGKQMQLYSESKRKLPVDLDYLHELHRRLTINLPAGYKANGLEAIRKNVVSGPAGTPDAWFRSDYKLEGSVLTITISEHYGALHYPVSGYESYRKVVNAAADFNKVVIVLKKS
jgi:hypothetical protein